MLGTVGNVTLAAVALGLLILVHEVGHFIAAKMIGVRVEVLSIGFWKKIVALKRGETEYRLSIIPLGGYVKLAGEGPGQCSGDPHEFWARPPWQRAIVFVAGVVMNLVLAVVGFIVAFTIGVPFIVAEIGGLETGWPAWEAGLREGDRIVQVASVEAPDFNDVVRKLAVSRGRVPIVVEREGRKLRFDVRPRKDERLGFRRIGFAPPYVLEVTGLDKVGGASGRAPASEAGIEPGDRILAVNGLRIDSVGQLTERIRRMGGRQVELTVERGGRLLTLPVRPEPEPRYLLGISCVSPVVEALQGGGAAQQIGLREGDRIIAAADRQVNSVVELEEAVRASDGEVRFLVQRGEERLELKAEISGEEELDQFLFSVILQSGTVLTWLNPEGPAWGAGMRPGDRILSIGTAEVKSWYEILAANESYGKQSRTVRWQRDGATYTASVAPVREESGDNARLGVQLNSRPKTIVRRYGFSKAVKTGFVKTFGSVAEFILHLKLMASRDISPKAMGGIVTIARTSYSAAQQGIGKLLYMTAFISAMLALVNLLPIPVLDGGHLLFIGIEKLRGKPVSETVMAVTQYVGLALLLVLVVYVTRNDIVRMLQY